MFRNSLRFGVLISLACSAACSGTDSYSNAGKGGAAGSNSSNMGGQLSAGASNAGSSAGGSSAAGVANMNGGANDANAGTAGASAGTTSGGAMNGGATNAGGANANGGIASVAGAAGASGGTVSGSGGNASGGWTAGANAGGTNAGANGSGGTTAAGGPSAGGKNMGGSNSAGSSSGGSNSGGKSSGGTSAGGASAGGKSAGGANAAGGASAGASSGGKSSGGASNGGTSANGGAGGSAGSCPEVNPQLCGMTEQHNLARANVNPVPSTPLPSMSWDSTVAAAAQAWADQCNFSHNAGAYGQNLYASAGGGPPTPTAVVNSWVSEAANYNYSANTCSGVCGHYTQVVWRSSTLLGCGIKACSVNSPFMNFTNWYIVVCNYSPPGNNGSRPY